VLGIDADALAAAVRRSAGTNGRRHERGAATHGARDASADATRQGTA
jgi:hypothetical protein